MSVRRRGGAEVTRGSTDMNHNKKSLNSSSFYWMNRFHRILIYLQFKRLECFSTPTEKSRQIVRWTISKCLIYDNMQVSDLYFWCLTVQIDRRIDFSISSPGDIPAAVSTEQPRWHGKATCQPRTVDLNNNNFCLPQIKEKITDKFSFAKYVLYIFNRG